MWGKRDTLVPIGLSFYYSLCDYSLLQPPVFRGLENYRTLLGDAVFWKGVRNTFAYAALALPLGLIMALAAAMLLNSDIRGVAVYRTIVFLPSIVPAVASNCTVLIAESSRQFGSSSLAATGASELQDEHHHDHRAGEQPAVRAAEACSNGWDRD